MRVPHIQPSSPAAGTGVSSECIHRLFEAQVEQAPDAVAVSFERQQLTYRQLNERANQVAHHLQALGVGPEVLVGLYVERSLDLVIGLLAILKAGGAYLPMDPSYPRDRLGFMLEDSKAPVVLTQARLAEGVNHAGARVVLLDADPELRTRPTVNPVSAVTPDNLIYSIYTSGSTGKPKGCLLTHRNVEWLFRETFAWFRFDASDVWTLFHSHAFDFSVWELWGALLYGGRVVVVPYTTSRSPDDFLRLLRTERVTVLNQTPSAFRQVIRAEEEAEPGGAPLALRYVIFGGEALEFQSLRPWFERHGYQRPQLINMYGITETTVFVTYRPVAKADLEVGRGSLIGRPIPELEVYILDENFQLVPPGVEGELFVGGTGVARGYLRRPALTAERFIPHPFSKVPGARLYRSGDLARQLEDGDIEYIGRADFQVKIRGFRIELGEIEAVLARHPAIRECVVIVREDSPGEKRLVAYLITRGQAPLSTGELREYLRASVPEYFVPEAFVFLDRLPLTSNGKLDRRALPAPMLERPELETAFVAPRDELEAKVAAIWAEVLHLDSVGQEDSFFDLGGNSLSATQIIARLRNEFRVEVSFRDMLSAPTPAALAQRLKATMGRKEGPQLPPIERAPRDIDLPLSFSQERVWFIERLQPGSHAYHTQATLRWQGALQVEVLRRSLSEILRRHEILRTSFVQKDGHPVQIIHPPREANVPFVDLQAIDPARREQEMQRLIDEDLERPFSLESGVPIRWILFRLSPVEHVLLHVEHHLVHDGWSLRLFVRELKELYVAFRDNRPAQLPELTVQFADFAYWQRRWMTGEVEERQLAFWKRTLTGAPAVLELPLDRPRPPMPSGRGAAPRFTLPAALCQQLRKFSRAEQQTLFTTMLSAFFILLHRYSSQDDICVGSGVANRRLKEIEPLLGMFVNTIVFRGDLSGEPTVRELLKRVQSMTLAAFAHEDMPFERVVQAVSPPRSLQHNPIFQAVFSFQDAAIPEVQIPGLSVEMTEGISNASAKFDINVIVVLAHDRPEITLIWEHNTDIFDAPTMARMVGHYQVVLEAILASPHSPISELPLLTPAERERLLVELGAPRTSPIPTTAVHALVEAQVRRAPEALAIVQGEAQLSYGELNRRANLLAHHLVARGIGPRTLVGVCLERSVDMVVALLAILKTGAAYLPMDPSYPGERLGFMAADGRVAALVTRTGLRERFAGSDVRLLCLDQEAAQIALQPDTDLPPRATAEDLAYVIYTSGTTGRPKGVPIQHAGLVNLLTWLGQEYALTGADRMLQISGPAFDATMLEIWPCLAHGASLHIVDEEARTSPARLLQFLTEQRISCCWLPTPLLEATLGEKLPSHLSLRVVSTGGDRLHRLPTSSLPFRLLNLYGPTENACVSTAAVVDPAREGDPSIGQAIVNTQAYVLDRKLNLLPVGVPGELCVSGSGLSPGYLNHPELTAEKFTLHRLAPDRAVRLYRTGDRVRLRADGELEFLGRIDLQVKIRGLRIELGEIEAVLCAHDSIQQAVVLAREDAPGERRLVAYVVSKPGSSATVAELRGFLKQKLPEYMVPAAFVALAELPLTPNGKVDRRALPAPDPARVREGSFAPARTPVEEVLVQLWESILRVERVGIHDDFFELGGHSLLATQVISRACQALGVDIPLRALFEARTVAELARQVEEAHRRTQGSRVPPIERVPREGRLSLSFAQERLWFLHQLEPDTSAYNLPTAVRLRGALDVGALEESLNEIVRRHEPLRTTFAVVGDAPVQVISPESRLRLERVDLRTLPEDERAARLRELSEEAAKRRFDLARGPVVRARLLQLGAEDHLLLVTMHHIASDGWSMGIFLSELTAAYEALVTGAKVELPELPLQYADYASWQRRWLTGEVLEQQLGYWRKRLAGLPGLLELPTDRLRPPVQTHQGARHTFSISQELTRALQVLSRKEGATPFMTLLAVFKVLLARLSGQQDICVGSPIAGRGRTEVERMIGFFVNTLVLRSDLSGSPTFRELLRQVREVTLGAYTHQDLPFERLVETLNPERSLDRSPLFQVMFNMLNLAERRLTLPGLQLEFSQSIDPESKFDLTLYSRVADGRFTFDIVYNTHLFTPERIAEMGRQYAKLLEEFAAQPETRIDAPPLVTPEARAHLPQPHRPLRSTPQPALHVTVSERALENGARLAVVDPRRSWTYAELTRRAHQLANHLRARGVGPGDVVAIYAHRSSALVWSVLGVLGSGAAFLLLDPSYPAARLLDRVRLARPRAWLELAAAGTLPAELREGLAALPGHLHLRLEEPGAAGDVLADAPAEAPGITVRGDDLAYVAFTSGSTGLPKGILGTHGPVSHFSAWQARTFGLTREDRFSVLSGLAHDPLLRDLFTPLSLGATLYMPAPEQLFTPGYLAEWLAEQRITVAHLTPAMGQLITQGASADRTTIELRYAFFAGDRLGRSELTRFRRMAPSARVINFYGATETPQAMGWFEVDRHEAMEGEAGVDIPVGRGISDVNLLVLNPRGQLAGVGELGEIVIRTPYLTRGYLGDEEQTRQRFLFQAFSGDQDDRAYRTGDLGRYRPGGEVEFAGRADGQVKVRGFRVELGEVENHLANHPAVTQAAVAAVEMKAGERWLIGYVVPRQGSPLHLPELRAFLAERLPDYMVPTTFVELPALPLTPNGKLDRKALPRPALDGALRNVGYVAPANEVEQILCELWARVLELPRIGTQDNVFALGAHSLSCMRVLQLAAPRGLRFTMKQMFQHQTVAALAAVATTRAGTRAPRAVEVGEVPLPPFHRRILSYGLVNPHHYRNSTYLFEVPPDMDAARLEKAVGALMMHHDAFRLRFQRSGDGWRAECLGEGTKVPFSRVDLSELPEELQASAIQEHAARLQASLDLTNGPVFQITLLWLGPSRPGRVLMVFHHMVEDGFSFAIVLEDLRTALGQLERGEAVELPSTSSFRAWATRLASFARSPEFRRQLTFWLEQTQEPVHRLPLDHPRGEQTMASERVISTRLGEEESQAVLQASRALGAGIHEVLLAGLVQLCTRWAGSSSQLVTLIGHGRDDLFEGVDLSRTVGRFTTRFPLLLSAGPRDTVADLVAAVKARVCAVPLNGVGYGLLRYGDANPEAAQLLRALPSPEVSFNYLGSHRRGGQDGSPFRIAREGVGPKSDARNARNVVWRLVTSIVDGSIQVDWAYSDRLHEKATVERAIGEYLGWLRALPS